MLYMIFKHNHWNLSYKGGQEPIIHLEADLHQAIDWAEQNECCWAFTDSNAGSALSKDYHHIRHLDKID